MRKRFYLAMAVLASLVSCQEEMESPEIDSLGQDSFYAEIEQPGNTKTYIDNFLNVRFQKGDQIAIFNNSTLADKYLIEDSADGDTSGTFNKVIEQGGDSFDVGSYTNAIVAYYPYTTLKLDATSAEKGNYILKGITLPSTQTYDPTHLVAQNALPMLSAKTDNDRRITFKNICGVLKLNIKGYGSIKQIAFKGNGNEKISGKATVSIKPDAMPLIAMDQTASSEVILDCGETGVALDPDTPKSFMIVLPPMAFQQGFEVTITDTEGGSMVKKTTTSKEIKRSTILNMKDAFTFGKKPDTPTPTPGETIPNNEIWYTTTDNAVITPDNTSATCFGANLTHNVYENGKGVMTFDGDVTMIGNIAFEACPTLAKIALPSTVQSIGTYAFDACRSLKEVYSSASAVPTGVENMFFESVQYIVVPTGCGKQYKTAEFWSAYSSKIVEYDYSAVLPIIYTQNIPTGVHERGGSATFNYFVLTPNFNSFTLEAITDAPWINNLRVNNGKVSFYVESNIGNPSRDGIITLIYPNAESINVTIHHLCPQPSMVVKVRGLEIPLIKVEGGTFTMGATPEQGTDADSDEKPAHQVTLSDYYIGQFQVTQELWEAVMGSNPSKRKGTTKPVEQASWYDIVNDFLPKLNAFTGKNFTLPTEAQWEFAARGGNKSQGYKYSGSNNIDEVAWYDDNSQRDTHSVGQKLPNELGIYDMSGNVTEWCSDWYYDSYRAEAQTDPTGPASGSSRVLRGGHYGNIAEGCRVSRRSNSFIENWEYFIGIRLVLSNIITSINNESLKLVEGQSEILNVLVNRITPIISKITWSSSNPSVANVDANGKVTAVGAGSAVITARVNDTGKEFSCNVEVFASIPSSMIVKVNGVEIPLIKVEGGTFTMGATSEQGTDAEREEKPAHQVTLSDYYIGQFQVTQELWEAVMGSNPSYHKGNSKYPVENVSWDNIVNDFLPKLNSLTGKNFTLPTEAQWEFAARGGNKSQGYKYSGSNNIDDVAWYDGNPTGGTHPVGKKLPNEIGIFDMSGNVYEWCSDWYGGYSAEAQSNPTGPASGSGRVLRGGYYDCYAESCRVSYRGGMGPDNKHYSNGFRLALSF